MTWESVDTMPEGLFFRTRRDGENGENRSMWVNDGAEGREYWDADGYSTVINPGSLAEPTHWWRE